MDICWGVAIVSRHRMIKPGTKFWPRLNQLLSTIWLGPLSWHSDGGATLTAINHQMELSIICWWCGRFAGTWQAMKSFRIGGYVPLRRSSIARSTRSFYNLDREHISPTTTYNFPAKTFEQISSHQHDQSSPVRRSHAYDSSMDLVFAVVVPEFDGAHLVTFHIHITTYH